MSLETDAWFARRTHGGSSWSEERLTPQSFDMRQAPDANGFFVGDYEGVGALGTTFYPFWSQSDNRGTNVSPRQHRRRSQQRRTPLQRPRATSLPRRSR